MNKNNKGLLVAGSLLLFVISFALIWNISIYINWISIFGLIAIIKTSGFWIDTVVTIVVLSAFGFLIYKSFQNDLYSDVLLNKIPDISRIKIANILFNISLIIKAISAVVAIVLIVSNFGNYGFGWILLYNLAGAARIYILGDAVKYIVLIVTPALNKYPEEYTNKMFYGFIEDEFKNTRIRGK